MKKNSIKKIFLSFTLAISLTTPVFAKNVNFKIDGVIKNLDMENEIVDSVLLANSVELSKALGTTLTANKSGASITMTKGDKSITMTSGTTDVTVNDSKGLKLPVEPKLIKMNLYVPVRFVAEQLGMKVTWNEISSTISISTGKKELAILDVKSEIKNDTKVISYKSGLKYAFDASNQLKNLEDSRKLIYDQLKKSQDLEILGKNTQDKKTEVAAKRSIKKLNNEIENFKENEKMIQDGLEYNYLKNIIKIYSNILDLKYIEESIDLEKLNVNNIKLKNEYGMESDYNLKNAQEKLNQLIKQKDNLKINLKDSKEAINLSLSLLYSGDNFFEYDTKFKPISNNVYNHIASKTIDDPKLKMEVREIDYLKYVKETTASDLNESEVSLDNDILTQERKHYDSLNKFEESIHTTYNKLKQLEESRSSIEIEYNIAKENYNKAVVSFEAGLITKYEVQAAKIPLLKCEIDLLKNQFDYDSLKFLYDRPYLLN